MSAIAKEKVFDELRRYHVNAFPEKLATDRMDNMKAEFVETEDKIIAMLLSLVNGKARFIDTTKELDALRLRIEQPAVASDEEEKHRVLFISKINWLRDILALAKQSDFQMRKVRVPKKPNSAIR